MFCDGYAALIETEHFDGNVLVVVVVVQCLENGREIGIAETRSFEIFVVGVVVPEVAGVFLDGGGSSEGLVNHGLRVEQELEVGVADGLDEVDGLFGRVAEIRLI